MKLYCVKFGNSKNSVPYFGFIKPYTGVRDIETYSTTYLPTSLINGIENYMEIPFNSIVRHKLIFSKYGQSKEMVKTSNGTIWYKNNIYERDVDNKGFNFIHYKHCLINPEIIFAFTDKSLAEIAHSTTIYLGQTEYIIYPEGEIFEITEEEFNKLEGVETFPSDKENGIFCGFNRFNNNQKQYITINRIEWD